MEYIVSKEKLEKYLNLEINDNDLFPSEAPAGTSFFDLQPENGECCIVTIDHIINLLKSFINGTIDDNRVKAYVETLIALDLYSFDDTTNRIHDLISNTVFTLDELKDVNGSIKKEDAEKLLSKILS